MSVFLPRKMVAISLILASLGLFSFIHWQFGMLLFHTLIELATTFVGFMMFAIAMNTKKFSRDNFLVFLGIGFFFISILDLFHAITVPGMPFFTTISHQVTLHFWIYTRLLEAALLLVAPYFLFKQLNEYIVFLFLASITFVIAWLAFALEAPILITEEGLTPFKNNVEYLIIIIMLLATAIYIKQREHFSNDTLRYLSMALVFGILSEYAFTLYLSFASTAFTVGHLLKLVSFWAIYQAIVQTTLNIPVKRLFRASNAYDVLPHPTVTINSKGNILKANKAAVDFTKVLATNIDTENQIISTNAHNNFHPKGVKEEDCHLCHAHKQAIPITAKLIYFSNINRWYEFYNQAITGDKDEKLVVQMLIDVTETKQAYTKLHNLTQQLTYTQKNARIGSWRLNLTTDDLWWSDEIFSIFEINPDEFDASYEAFLGAIHPQDRDRVNNAYLNSLKSKQSYQIEHRLLMADGRVKFVLEQCETTFDHDGKPIVSKGSVQDITQQHDMAQALKHAEKMDSLGKLTGGIAHDFNNLLGIILGYTELLKTELKGNTKLTGYSESIEKAGHRGADLVRKLLSFSKKKNPDISLININKVISSSKDMLSKTLTAAIELETNLFAELWDVQVNISDLDDIILNLSINSAHAMPNGGKLIISTSNVNLSAISGKLLNIKAGEYVCLAIEDTGCGMTEEVKNRIFEPFFTTKKSHGTGLGLSQVYGFVQSAAGTIQVESEEGVGSCFTLYLPRYIPNSQDKDESAVSKYLPSLAGNENILIVDDEPALVELAQHILQEKGYHTYTATSAKQALTMLQSTSIDLLLSDIIMPRMDGFELAHQVNLLYPNVKVILSSGYRNEQQQKDYQGIIIEKPYNAYSLLLEVRQTLEKETVPE